jgi:hypothetical protein
MRREAMMFLSTGLNPQAFLFVIIFPFSFFILPFYIYKFDWTGKAGGQDRQVMVINKRSICIKKSANHDNCELSVGQGIVAITKGDITAKSSQIPLFRWIPRLLIDVL